MSYDYEQDLSCPSSVLNPLTQSQRQCSSSSQRQNLQSRSAEHFHNSSPQVMEEPNSFNRWVMDLGVNTINRRPQDTQPKNKKIVKESRKNNRMVMNMDEGRRGRRKKTVKSIIRRFEERIEHYIGVQLRSNEYLKYLRKKYSIRLENNTRRGILLFQYKLRKVSQIVGSQLLNEMKVILDELYKSIDIAQEEFIENYNDKLRMGRIQQEYRKLKDQLVDGDKTMFKNFKQAARLILIEGNIGEAIIELYQLFHQCKQIGIEVEETISIMQKNQEIYNRGQQHRSEMEEEEEVVEGASERKQPSEITMQLAELQDRVKGWRSRILDKQKPRRQEKRKRQSQKRERQRRERQRRQ